MASATVKKIEKTAEEVRATILKRQKPRLRFPLRSLSNVKYDPKKGFFEMRGRKKERTLTVSTVKTFAQTLRMMALSKELVAQDDIATKREAYYVSKNWEDARFLEQAESDAVMDDVEALFEVNREQIGFVPEEKGGEISGKLIIVDKDSETGKPLKIDCTKFGSGAYSIPISVEHLKFETDADFILVIETAGMFQRLVKHKYWKTANCVLVSMGGLPPLHPPPGRLQEDPRLRLRRRRPVRYFQHLPHAQGRLRERGAPERVLLRPAGALSGDHAAGHRRLQAPHPPAQGRGRQARPRRHQERPVLPAPQGLGRRDGASPEDGRARRAAGPRQVGPQLRHRHLPAGEAEAAGEVPAVTVRAASTGPSSSWPAPRAHRQSCAVPVTGRAQRTRPRRQSRRISRAALRPAAPMTPPPGCVQAPHR